MGDAHQEVDSTIKKSDIRGVVVRGSATGFAQEILAGPHRMIADEPLSAGGTDAGLSPMNFYWPLWGPDFDYGRDVRSQERMAARGSYGQSAALEGPRR